MSSVQKRAALAVVAMLAAASAATAQPRPYIGYVYPAGGQQGTTFRIKLGGQNLDGVDGVAITGKGASGTVVEYLRKLGPQESTLLREQLDEVKKHVPKKSWDMLTQATEGADASMNSDIGMLSPEMMSRLTSGGHRSAAPIIRLESLGIDKSMVSLVTRIRSRMNEYVLRPASAAISSLVIAEITLAPNAGPGKRELRLVTPRGVSNPLVFYVGQLPEASRVPMLTSEIQVLGKEALALRRRHEDSDSERLITIPCTVNGQIGSAEVHRYRFKARKGQRLVISTAARELVPFIADAVPGWFQPVLTLYDPDGREVAYNDDYRFDPDPLIRFEVPREGRYMMEITDAIYRGREDFVYRVTIDETPLVTSIFPLGARVGTSPSIAMEGWNLEEARLDPPPADAQAGVHFLTATKGRRRSNPVPFALDTLPESLDKEPNNDPEHAQKIELPVIINGRIDRPDDWDVFQFTGRAGQTIAAEVMARRLKSPLDSLLRLTDAQGKLLAINDDHDDPEGGTNTHYADSYLAFKLPADGTYYVHVGDTTRSGGPEYGYRLRISGPRPDFALRLVPSSVFLRRQNTGTLSVYVDRKDGFAGSIKLALKNPPTGIWASPVTITGQRPVGNLTIKASATAPAGLFELVVEGSSRIGSNEIVREAVPAEDRMQAFLWRHLVPAEELKGYVFDPATDGAKPRPKRDYTAVAATAKDATAPKGATTSKDGAAGKGKFTKAQVVGRLRQLDRLFDEGLLSAEFYRKKVAECGVSE
jgi:hypothetical protein